MALRAGRVGVRKDQVDNNGVITGGGEYELPVASADTLGGVKVGEGLSIADGVLSASGSSSTVTVKEKAITKKYENASGTWQTIATGLTLPYGVYFVSAFINVPTDCDACVRIKSATGLTINPNVYTGRTVSGLESNPINIAGINWVGNVSVTDMVNNVNIDFEVYMSGTSDTTTDYNVLVQAIPIEGFANVTVVANVTGKNSGTPSDTNTWKRSPLMATLTEGTYLAVIGAEINTGRDLAMKTSLDTDVLTSVTKSSLSSSPLGSIAVNAAKIYNIQSDTDLYIDIMSSPVTGATCRCAIYKIS